MPLHLLFIILLAACHGPSHFVLNMFAKNVNPQSEQRLDESGVPRVVFITFSL